jgi:hypothetical protein
MPDRDPLVDSTGTARRLQALAVNCWPSVELGRRLGHRPERARNLIHKLRTGRHVRRSTAQAVAALYTELAHQIGPSMAARSNARRAGWAGPTQWAGRDIDDPDTEPHPALPLFPHRRAGLDRNCPHSCHPGDISEPREAAS